MPFEQSSLRQQGFQGFTPLIELPANCDHIPAAPGVYIVVFPPTDLPEMLSVSRGGHFKGEDPTVPLDVLKKKWIPDVETVYIGRSSNLRIRLGDFSRYGNGQPVGHRGGRYLWQLAGGDDLLVGWKTVDDPRTVEAEMMEEFENHYGSLPFANLVRARLPLATA